jgi:1,4-dihydroxy-2-naphthoyl-CoA hydrolase
MRRPAFTDEELRSDGPARHVEARMVRFQDIDAAGIVFYPRVLEYFSDAYIAMLLARGYDLPASLAKGGVGVPLVHAEADYLHPLRFGDAMSIEVLAAKVGGSSSFTIGYRVRSGERIAAVGQTVHVCIDRSTFKSCPIPGEIRAAIGAQ